MQFLLPLVIAHKKLIPAGKNAIEESINNVLLLETNGCVLSTLSTYSKIEGTRARLQGVARCCEVLVQGRSKQKTISVVAINF